jgi:hypothetical protein
MSAPRTIIDRPAFSAPREHSVGPPSVQVVQPAITLPAHASVSVEQRSRGAPPGPLLARRGQTSAGAGRSKESRGGSSRWPCIPVGQCRAWIEWSPGRCLERVFGSRPLPQYHSEEKARQNCTFRSFHTQVRGSKAGPSKRVNKYDALNGNHYGCTTADGEYGEVEVSATTLTIAHETAKAVINAFQWSGPQRHVPN